MAARAAYQAQEGQQAAWLPLALGGVAARTAAAAAPRLTSMAAQRSSVAGRRSSMATRRSLVAAAVAAAAAHGLSSVAAAHGLCSAEQRLAAGARRQGGSVDGRGAGSGERWWPGGGFRQPNGVGFVKLAPLGLENFAARAQGIYWSRLVQADVIDDRMY